MSRLVPPRFPAPSGVGKPSSVPPGRGQGGQTPVQKAQEEYLNLQRQIALKAEQTAAEKLISGLVEPPTINYSAIQDMEQGNSLSIYPKNQKKFEEEGVVAPPGGSYLNPRTQEDLTGRKALAGIISINPEKGTGSLKIHPEETEVVGSPDEKGATLIKTNLFKKEKGWKWLNAPKGYENATTLISVENKGKHYYTLKTLFPKGVNLQTYPTSKTEPRLRPTTKGFVKLGDVVGKVNIRGNQHPVYNTISAFAQGGLVDKPLYPR